MTWIEIVWSVTTAASLVLAAIHGTVWLQKRDAPVHLAFACCALGGAGMMLFELLLMHASSTAQYATLARWIHVPISVFVLSLIAFVRSYLGASRNWLALLAAGLRVATLVATMLLPVSVN